MADFITNVKTINSAARTVLVAGAVGLIGYGGWFGYSNYIQPSVEAKQAIQDLQNLKAEFEKNELALKETKLALEQVTIRNERLETSMKLIKVDRRMANVTVLETGKDDNGESFMEVRFVEVDEKGQPVGTARDYTLQGEKLYVDGWIVSFEDKYIEDADNLRGASLFVFKSIYGDLERPIDGKRLDIESMDQPPGIYNDQTKRKFEQRIWNDFWSVCNDDDKQKSLGIRASHGTTSYVKGEKGKTYQVNIRAIGGMTLKPVESP